MEDQYGVTHGAFIVALGRAKCPVMHLQFRERFAGPKMEIVEDVIARFWRRIIRSGEADCQADANTQNYTNLEAFPNHERRIGQCPDFGKSQPRNWSLGQRARPTHFTSNANI